MTNEQASTSPADRARQEVIQEPEQAGTAGSIGIVTGVPGRHIKATGVLDLRGVPPEKVAEIESIRSTGAVLLDESNRLALRPDSVRSTGVVAVVPPDVRVMTVPWLELSRASLEAMPAGQKLMLLGLTYFKPDVPPALVAEKFELLQIVGPLIACAGVQGALLGKAQVIGPTITLPDDAGPVVPSIGENKMSSAYLSHLPDGIIYLNIGKTELPDDVTEELLARKIRSYYNIGATVGPAPLLDLLNARCPTNLGVFEEPGAEEEEPEGPPGEAAAGSPSQ